MADGYVFDVMDSDFETAVLERSKDVPVLVDFWAPWCGPCQVLGPMLEKLAEEFQGGFVLAKVNSDENPGLAQVFQIQSIPTVHLLKDGKVADGFMGALSESQLREFLTKNGVEPGAAVGEEDRVTRAQALLEEGRDADAETLLERALQEAPEDARILLLLARIAIGRGDETAALARLDAISEEDEGALRDAERLRGALAFREACGDGEASHRARLAADAEDLGARYALGCCLASSGKYEEALEEFLTVIKKDKTFRDGAARKAMVTIFGLLGPGHDLAGQYRKQLVIYL